MRILLVGATGVIGRELLPMLVADGHEVVATTRSAGKLAGLAALSAPSVTAVELDVLDAAATRAAVHRIEPEVIIHQATALSSLGNNVRKFAALFATTNQLRTVGTANLIAAGRDVGVRRYLVQSFGGGWQLEPVGAMVKDEQAALLSDPPAALDSTLDALRLLETTVGDEPGGVVLRYGYLYGPGTSLDRDGVQVVAVRRRQVPLVGAAAGYWSFVHVRDAAAATVAALDRGSGVYNVVDDDPAPVRDWLPQLASVLGAKPPRRVPAWLARIAAGNAAVHVMTASRGSSNARAKAELGWAPTFASWRDGFAAELGSGH
jgi:nucleoside-diphosphate-sugar epimerase